VAFVGMPFCFLVQNLAEIRKSVDELWPKNDFQDGGRRHIEFLKKFNFWCHVTTAFAICTEFHQNRTIFH